MEKALSCFEIFFIYEKHDFFSKAIVNYFLKVNSLLEIVHLYFIRYNIFIGIAFVAVLIFS